MTVSTDDFFRMLSKWRSEGRSIRGFLLTEGVLFDFRCNVHGVSPPGFSLKWESGDLNVRLRPDMTLEYADPREAPPEFAGLADKIVCGLEVRGRLGRLALFELRD